MRAGLLRALLAVGCLWLAAGQTPDLCSATGPRATCGERGVEGPTCEALGCCWAPDPLPKEAWQPDVYLPECFYPNTGASTYTLGEAGAGAVQATGNATLELQQRTQPELGPDVERALLSLEQVAPAIVRVRITDGNNSRYTVPPTFFPPTSVLGGGGQSEGAGPPLFQVLVEPDPLGLAVVRGDPAVATFNTTGLRLVFKEQYIELNTWVRPSATLYGAGERSSATTYITRNGYPYTLWARDLGPAEAMRNSYSSWPFVMVLEADGTAWGMFLHSSAGMDVVATDQVLSWRVIGGMVDLFVMVGPTPLDVMQQLTRVVGRPALPPYWALGYHQAGYYPSLAAARAVVEEYAAANLPLEALWLDADYMDGYRLFTLDPVTFPQAEVQAFATELAQGGRKLVPVLQPGVKADPGYETYIDGLAQAAFLRGQDDTPYLGWAWPGGVHFPDFGWAPAAAEFWRSQLALFASLFDWAGLWVDMQEVSNFCSGDICTLPTEQALVAQRGLPETVCQALCLSPEAGGLSPANASLVQPPYQIANNLQAEPLNTQAVGVLAVHSGGAAEYDAHNLYGLSMAQATAAAVREIKATRPFVLARSTYPGAGAYAAHWTGATNSTWADLGRALPGVIASGLAGIPMAGADVCGFYGNATTQLCARWAELAALFPFMRGHSDRNTTAQELTSRPELTAAARSALALRYSLLPFFYTLAQNASEGGAPVLRPLWMAFPQDPLTHPISSQFMLGDALMAVPQLAQDELWVSGYFPQGMWYDVVDNTTVDARSSALNATLYAPLGSPPAYLRGGAAVPRQRPALTTAAVKASPLSFSVALPEPVFNVSVPRGAQDPSGIGFVQSDPATAVRNVTFTAAGYAYNDDGEAPEVTVTCCNFLSVTTTVRLSAVDVTVDVAPTAPPPPRPPLPAAPAAVRPPPPKPVPKPTPAPTPAPGAAPTPAPAPAPGDPAPLLRRRSLAGFNATFNATTFFPNVTTNISYSAAVEIRFGRPAAGADAVAPACALEPGAPSVEWPPLEALRVLGWQLEGPVQGASLELDGVATPIPPGQITADGLQLIVSLGAAPLQLQCGQVLRLSWSVSWPAPWVPWFPAEAVPLGQPQPQPQPQPQAEPGAAAAPVP